MSFYCVVQDFKLDQLDVIYAGSDRSFYCVIRAFKLDQLYVIYVEPDRSFYCVIRAFKFDQLVLSTLDWIGHFTMSSGLLNLTS